LKPGDVLVGVLVAVAWQKAAWSHVAVSSGVGQNLKAVNSQPVPGPTAV
jgi:hypothetical protein